MCSPYTIPMRLPARVKALHVRNVLDHRLWGSLPTVAVRVGCLQCFCASDLGRIVARLFFSLSPRRLLKLENGHDVASQLQSMYFEVGVRRDGVPGPVDFQVSGPSVSGGHGHRRVQAFAGRGQGHNNGRVMQCWSLAVQL